MDELTLTVGSLFSGIGGFDLGLERAGMRVVWQAETDEAASAVLAAHWPEVANLGDVAGVGVRLEADRRSNGSDAAVRGARAHADEQSRACGVDLLCGGFPCQDLSVAGRRKGLAGERSGLFFEFARVADALRPRWILVENVPGLLSSNQGRDFALVLTILAELGYEDLSWRVVDALGFGVPQRRRRLFVVGRLGAGAGTRAVLLDCEGRPWRAPQSGEAGAGAAGVAAASTLQGRGNRLDAESAAGGHLIASALTAAAGHHGHSSPRGDGSDNIIPVGFDARQDPDSWSGHSGPLDTDPYTQVVAKSFREDQSGDCYEADYITAVSAGGGKPGQGYPAARIGARVRRLTPLECERLQSFPDGWTVPAGSDSARYRCVGNAVAVPVAQWLGERITAYEEGQA